MPFAESEHGALLTPAASGATTLELSPDRCALTACGFADGVNLMLLDSSGQFDIFTVTAVDGMAVSVRHQGLNPSGSYAAGLRWSLSNRRRSRSTDPLAPCVFTTETQPISSSGRCRGSEGRVFGEGEPPVWPRPPDGEANCLYAADGTYPERAARPGSAGTADRVDRHADRRPLVRHGGYAIRRRPAAGPANAGVGQAAGGGCGGPGTDRARFANPGSAWRSALS